MTKILVIEDEKEIVKLLKYNLEKEGYAFFAAYNGEEGYVLFKKIKPNLIILDLMLPKMNGIELCKQVRKESKVPIIMLTAKKDETDRVLGLELGADDYLTKPFSVKELAARIKSVLRRSHDQGSEIESLQMGELEIDLERYEVTLRNKPVNLSSKEFSLLKVLLGAKGRVLTREQLLEQVWGFEQAPEIDTRTVDQHVARLRAKLGSESNHLVTKECRV